MQSCGVIVKRSCIYIEKVCGIRVDDLRPWPGRSRKLFPKNMEYLNHSQNMIPLHHGSLKHIRMYSKKYIYKKMSAVKDEVCKKIPCIFAMKLIITLINSQLRASRIIWCIFFSIPVVIYTVFLSSANCFVLFRFVNF